ncbi:MAG: hypothetical protein J0L93_06130 [Deltaproteobacteria bacterium]|nr:hypothetical protein [Deltaproteobacteria bacterium]
MKKPLLIVTIVLILAALLTYEMLKLAQIQCSLCLTFNGKRQCSKALGPTADAATEEAHRNACALLTSGVTEVVACNRVESEELSCSHP